MQIRVWDAPLRLFHWALAASFTLAWLLRSDQTLHLHLLAGYLFSALLLFRLLWGVIGGRHARFRDFLYGPGAVLDYLKALLRGRARRHPGHNPAGSWAVFAMLGLGILIGITGLLTLARILHQGFDAQGEAGKAAWVIVRKVIAVAMA
ncbi:cytochrome b/b6 domain-containing protein [Thiohalobacter sp. IOR34]|uniref:cytochrome b/b6 domain-containing protein n=1 Tax=Thiohalobacter sp. IOR34 TaxID=3057176 RepID=UPI0025B23E50|nr:cytochrome b/b6 domain-containing protein [Thiohalobacter sp. IOR34]WJW74303.1 cytochrome b/b6 domain-containing protein [Thiohalobacter sp. IOR34]